MERGFNEGAPWAVASTIQCSESAVDCTTNVESLPSLFASPQIADTNRGTMSEVRSNIAKVEAALVQLSTSANDGEGLTSTSPPEYSTHILDDQSDLLDLNWSGNEQNAVPGQRQSIHTDALRTAFASDITNAEIEGNNHEKFQYTPLSSITQPSIENELPIVTLVEDASAPLKPVSDQAGQSRAAGIDSSSNPPATGASPKSDSAAHRALYIKPIPSSTRSDLHRNSSVENTSTPESPFFNYDVSLDNIRNPKHSALLEGSDGLGAGANKIEHVPSESPPDLIQAVIRADVQDVRRLLDLRHDIESRHPTNGRTALLLVAALGHIELLQILLARNACVDAKDATDRTALHYAVSEGHFRCVQLLLSAGASTTVYDIWGESLLHRAVRYGSLNEDGLKLLLSQHPDPIQPRESRGFTILHLVAKDHSPNMAKLICDTLQTVKHHPNCPIKVTNSNLASQSQPCDCPLVLPGLALEDREGRTALQRAIFSLLPRTVKILLKYSPAAVNAPQLENNLWRNSNLQGEIQWERPIHFAVRTKSAGEKKHEAFIEVLLAAGPDLGLLNSHGQTPLEVAICHKNQFAARALLKCGAPFIGTTESSGTESLLAKAIKHFPPTVLLGLLSSASMSNLVKRGELDVAFIREAQSRNKWNYIQAFLESRRVSKTGLGTILNEEKTLKFAIREGSEDAVKSLLDAGAQLSTQLTNSKLKCQAVHIAAEGCSIPILKTLLQHGGSILTENSDGYLPFHHAIRYSDCNMIIACFDAMILELDRTSEGFDDRLWVVMYVAIGLACRQESVEKVKLILDLAKEESVLETFSHEVLHIAVARGRINVVMYLLEQGHDPQATRDTLKDGNLQTVLEVPFRPIASVRGQSPNKLVDYEECKTIIRKAIDQKETKPPGRTSKQKDKETKPSGRKRKEKVSRARKSG